ncbi:TPM domain-containing protein, partial [Macromonas nakdongensis]|uniref:TPM domain-containing protein n=1 Tax=Macromonas nakdongensis TaxID=1843082 RepID=UPI001E646CDC
MPPLTARVIDQTATLGAAERQALEDKLAAFERERGSQVVVVLVPSTAPEDIADYSQRLGDAWKIGRREVGDGVLLVVAKNDRRLRIATMKAVEGAIPDLVARRIIDQSIAPHFKQGDYAAGLNAGVDAIIAQLKGEILPLPASGATGSTGADDWTDTLALLGFGALFLNLLLREILGNKLGTVAAPLATGVLAAYLTASPWIGVGVGLLALVVG